MTTALAEHKNAETLVEERIAASLERIAGELELIRTLLEERHTQAPAVAATSGPWLRHPPAR
ncbi:MAG TPA: hypothetical protein VM184_01995 [Gaiellaceae bacterium]|nr:hypothetical protein [Gaiellaceae bacterium]